MVHDLHSVQRDDRYRVVHAVRCGLRIIAGASAVIGAVACAPATYPLTTTEFGNACRSIGLEGTVVGSPYDQRYAWLVSDNGFRVELVWPIGYRARFVPELEVLDQSGGVEWRQGDKVHEACVKGPPEDPQRVVLIRSEL